MGQVNISVIFNANFAFIIRDTSYFFNKQPVTRKPLTLEQNRWNFAPRGKHTE